MKFTILKNVFAEPKRYFLLGIIGFFSLFLLGLNLLFINSLPLGVIIAPVYLFIVSLFCGNVLFPRESQRFRIFYGFIVFFCLLVILGTIAYWIHDLSNLPILIILFLLTISLIYLNRNRRPVLSLTGIRLKERIAELNVGILDYLFLSLVGLSFYFLFAARTGESIHPFWSIVSSWFFVSLFLAIVVLLLKIWRGKSPSGLLLFYAILLILIPACGYLIVMHQPYATMKGAMVLEYDRMVTQFGRFVSDPTLPEAAKSVIGKGILTVGFHVGDAFLIKLFQVPPQKFALFFVPILFTMMVVLTPFDLMRSLAPRQKGLALICSLSFLATQHTIFLFTPPGKDETLALGLLLVNVLLWVKFLQNQGFRWTSFIPSVIVLGAILLIHQFVGLFALFLAVSAVTLFLLKPFQDGRSRLLLWLGLNIGFMFIWTFGYPYLHSLTSYIIGTPAGGAVDIHQFTLSKFIVTIAPPPWSNEWSVYFTYVLIIVGAIAAFRYRLNKNWLAMSLSLIVLAFFYFGIVGNFHVYSESFRFFYYLNFLAFPMVGVGLYWLVSRVMGLRAGPYIILKEKSKFISLKPLPLAICVLLLASLFTTSIWAGYPGEHSMSPYRQSKYHIRYPSDYDVAALDFIKASEKESGDFFIVGDIDTCAAGVHTMGYQVIPTGEGYVSVFSFFVGGAWASNEPFNMAVGEPIKYLVEGTNFTNSLANKTYLIVTYRLGIDRLRSLVDFYTEYLGRPVYSTEDKVYVFSYNREQIAALLSEATEGQLILFDDERVEDKFWHVMLIGNGDLTFSASDNTELKKQGDSCLQVTIGPGEYERATLRHVWDEPADFGESKYLLLFAYGGKTGRQFNIVFRSVEPVMANFFYYTITDDFEGWRLLVIPLESFEMGGSPSWSVIKEMLIQFAGGWSPGEMYFDQISVAKRVALKLLYEESAIYLP